MSIISLNIFPSLLFFNHFSRVWRFRLSEVPPFYFLVFSFLFLARHRLTRYLGHLNWLCCLEDLTIRFRLVLALLRYWTTLQCCWHIAPRAFIHRKCSMSHVTALKRKFYLLLLFKYPGKNIFGTWKSAAVLGGGDQRRGGIFFKFCIEG